MKIETKFALGDKVWLLRPDDWDPIYPSTLVVDEANVAGIRIKPGEVLLHYQVYLEDVPIDFLEADLYATKEEAQEACDTQNRANKICNEAVEDGVPDADSIEDLKNRVKRLEEKFDQVLKKEIDDGK